ncbi:vomeronasal type-2 receptor 26-like [Pelobates cultripes]|uniref:Vomeronasal type-2 receptor 26-like n=1 Tax=Pelobates cultripes TaxID=61616 RepID=A0AAD1SFH4_PELCU|nr:vomeronasal type-2 receptor 26-like [Pelobates cultripes]
MTKSGPTQRPNPHQRILHHTGMLDKLMTRSTTTPNNKRDHKIPRARCNEVCHHGYRKAPGGSYHKCCYDCVPCSEGEMSNVTDSDNCQTCPDNEWPNENKTKCIPKNYDFLSYENDNITSIFSSISILFSLIVVFILRILIIFWETPIVRANNRNLSFVLLVSLMLSFLCVFLFLGRPVDITCMLRQTSFGIIFSVAVSSVLGKTIMVYIAFKATKPGSSWRKWVGVKVSNIIVLICSSIQILINVLWLCISPPYQELDMHSYPGRIIIQCNEGSVIAFYSVLGYMGVLAAVSFIIAYFARTLPDSFNEAKPFLLLAALSDSRTSFLLLADPSCSLLPLLSHCCLFLLISVPFCSFSYFTSVLLLPLPAPRCPLLLLAALSSSLLLFVLLYLCAPSDSFCSFRFVLLLSLSDHC